MSRQTHARSGLDHVEVVIRRVVDRNVARYFQNLRPSQITWKSPGQVVTAADVAIEEELAADLTAIVAGEVLGEESTASFIHDPDQATWVIDPLDGTREFVSGSPRFATMVALWQGDRGVASWIYAPLCDQMWTAKAGAGALVNEQIPASSLVSAGVYVPREEYITATVRECARRLQREGTTTIPCDVVALAYTQMALGEVAGAIFDWDSPWDHAAGILLCQESGLVCRYATAEPYDPFRRDGPPLVVARDEETWRRLSRLAVSSTTPGDDGFA